MEQQLSLHLKNFNKRVQAMNQTNSKELVLSSAEARNIQSEVFELLARINDLVDLREKNANEVINIQVKGGGF